ncbi:MAG: hypothetical protein ISR84_03435 [Kiritimatiellales bacterium]|nr:hypothetical protein [Kiritimatiellales bacterium]
MSTLKLNEYQSNFDPATGDELSLWFGKHNDTIDGLTVLLSGVPLLRNDKTGAIFFPDRTKKVIHFFLEDAKKKGELGINLSPKESGNKRYDYAQKVDFIYSSIDHEYIPGLQRPWEEGFLTPVFFSLSVLNKYSQNPGYSLELSSATWGTISCGTQWHIDFGINKNKKVMMWLGDIDSLPENEQYYLRSENIESDHCIHSQFYDSQIENKWADPSVEDRVLKLRADLSELTEKKCNEPLYILDGEVSKVIANLDKPVFWEDKNVSPTIEALNRIFVESINAKTLKQAIKKSDPTLDIKAKNGLKLFSMWIEHCLNSTDSYKIMSPFFVLYDFRILVCHLQSQKRQDEQLESINERLQILKSNTDYEAIYNALFTQLESSYTEILELTSGWTLS